MIEKLKQEMKVYDIRKEHVNAEIDSSRHPSFSTL